MDLRVKTHIYLQCIKKCRLGFLGNCSDCHFLPPYCFLKPLGSN